MTVGFFDGTLLTLRAKGFLMIVDRVRERLEALGMSPYDAALKLGRNRNYIYDFLIGRKKEFKGNGPAQLAKLLNCSVAYLNGEVDDPEQEAPQTDLSSGVPIVGVVETGAWRSKPPKASVAPVQTPIAPDPRYPVSSQVAYLVRGTGMVGLGITEPMIVVATRIAAETVMGAIAAGQLVVVEQSRSGMTEVSVRRFTPAARGAHLVAVDEAGEADIATLSDDSGDGVRTSITGIVLATIRVY